MIALRPVSGTGSIMDFHLAHVDQPVDEAAQPVFVEVEIG